MAGMKQLKWTIITDSLMQRGTTIGSGDTKIGADGKREVDPLGRIEFRCHPDDVEAVVEEMKKFAAKMFPDNDLEFSLLS